MKTSVLQVLAVSCMILLNACTKSDFLSKKPLTNLLTPQTVTDYYYIMDIATQVYLGGLAQVSSDDYTVTFEQMQSSINATQRNAYTWEKDIYAGEADIEDWNAPYKNVFYANCVLDGLAGLKDANTPEAQFVKGWALFSRAYSFYDLTRNFCKAYDASSANTDPGIPLRLSSAINYTLPRASLQQSFDQIFADLSVAVDLLPATRSSSNFNRPGKLAVYALMARMYLDMRNYTQAEKYADLSLDIYKTLIDYNTVNGAASIPFAPTNDELIFNSNGASPYSFMNSGTSGGRAAEDLINLYDPNDLRLSVFYTKQPDNSYSRNRGYNGRGFNPFSGLATDELYLVKAECLARRGETTSAMDWLNLLLIKRFSNTVPYVDLTASSPADALSKVLQERRKELVWRCIRWHDIKRLNMEGANITLTREVNGQTYSLPPNDPRYVFPIPTSEISLTGIQQNIR